MHSTAPHFSLLTKRRPLRLHAILGLLATSAMGGCSNEVVKVTPTAPCTSTVIEEKLTQSSLTKLDLLLTIDNSRSMADKQQLLALAVPELIKTFANPPCVDEVGAPVSMQPNAPTDPCPNGSQRQFEPILDIHVGVISSSIGGHGADSCPNVDTQSKECAPAPNLTNNDRGRLLSRTDPCSGTNIPTYQNKGFLAWDPTQIANPPGEKVLDDGNGNGLAPTLRELVLGAGQIGCGYESQLESIYRFLADPDPYASITVENFKATPQGTDTVLLEQRKAFLRSDSLLAIVMLTDENDCSIKEYGQFYYVGQLRNGATPVRLPRARQECATNPNDPCCKSCGQGQGSCPDDPTCKDPNGGNGPALLSDAEDHINLRCWDQKRRFGIDFLYPTDRYVQAFSSSTIANRNGELVPNPIFSDLTPEDGTDYIRDPSLVFFAGIVGVPWQNIARDPVDASKGFKQGYELSIPDSNGLTGWDVILGDPANNVKPRDPHMIETYQKRQGLPDASMPSSDPVHGHEWTIPNDDLQYACIFPLLPGAERDCTDMNLSACDCSNPTNDNPLCQSDPNNNNQRTLQVRAKAYPGIRPLSVIKDLDSQGIVASVCPPQVNDSSAADFGYRPAIRSITDTIGQRLTPVVSGQCLPRVLDPAPDGTVSCTIVEARNSGGNCSCNPEKGRLSIPANSDAAALVTKAQQDPLASSAGWDCFCAIPQLGGEELNACRNDAGDSPAINGELIDGWCYVDAYSVPPANPDIVSKCPENEKRIIRFVGAGQPNNGATTFVTCQIASTTCNP